VDNSDSFYSKCRLWLSQFFVKLAIRFKWHKASYYTAQELNQMLTASFPQTIPLSLANTDGQVVINNAELSMPASENKLHIQLYCGFSLSVVNHDIYRSHLIVSGTVTPIYSPSEKAICIKDMQLSDLRLVNDDYAFIESTTQIATLFVPKSFKYLLLSTMSITLSVLKGVVPNELINYLELFSSGSKQQVLDYHKKDIAQLVLAKVEQQDWRYLLDESDFEEQLFAEFGQEVAVENEHLVFKFHLDE